jgi:uncharacterized membrane protein
MYSANPFDPKTVLLAKHAQHVALVHFPIALFMAGAALDAVAQWTRRKALEEAAYYNFLLAAVSVVPVIATGLMAWQFQLEGQRLKGVLLTHFVAASASAAVIVASWWAHFRARSQGMPLAVRYRLALELLGVLLVGMTGHLGGFLTGVNGPG